MRKTILTVAAAVALAAGGRAGEAKPDLDKVPKPIMEAVRKRFPKAEITGAAEETDSRSARCVV